MDNEEATEHTEQNIPPGNNSSRKKRRRVLKCLSIFVGIVLIIGCFVMASYSYIFLDDCKESSCHDASPEEITTAKVFRFISAGLFIIGIFMVAFSLCTNKGEREVENLADLRRISLHTVACVISEAAKEKTPSILSSQAYINSGLHCSVPGLNGIPEDSIIRNNGDPELLTSCSTLEAVSIRGLFDKSLLNLTPPPSYMEALRMQIPTR